MYNFFCNEQIFTPPTRSTTALEVGDSEETEEQQKIPSAEEKRRYRAIAAGCM